MAGHSKNRIGSMIRCALFAALICVGAFIRVPLPFVPFTMQTAFVLLAGLMLEKTWAAASCALYMGLGLAGLPVFSMGGGIGYVLQPTFGYILGFIAGAYLCAAALGTAKRRASGRLRFLSYFAAGLLCLCAVYAVGAGYYAMMMAILGTPLAFPIVISRCVLATGAGDIACAAACALVRLKMPARLMSAQGA